MNPSHDNRYLSEVPVAEAGMLVRKSALEVYEAFMDPEITTKFWFTKSSGRLEAGKHIRWEWEMYGVSSAVEVKELIPCKRIIIVWGEDDKPTQVEFSFTARTPDTTFVSVLNSGFTGSADEVVAQAMDAAAGFALVLAGLKAYLERGIELHLVDDRFPDLHIDLKRGGLQNG